MLAINIAYTAPINPAGASPVLTPAQIWDGLVHKVHHAEKFVPLITACEVTGKSDDGSTITRRVTFQAGVGPMPRDTVTEVCKLFAPCRVDFEQEDGTTIGNYVSEGADGELYMTYVFQWRAEGVEEGSEQATALKERYRKVSSGLYLGGDFVVC
jgi:hypothetical protein